MVELAQRNEIALQTGFHATARAKNGGARGIEAGVGLQTTTTTYIEKPLDPLPEQEKARGNLQDRQRCEQSLHLFQHNNGKMDGKSVEQG